jgi:hypothetical protein
LNSTSGIFQNGRHLSSGTFRFIKFLKSKKFIILGKEALYGLPEFLGPAKGNNLTKWKVPCFQYLPVGKIPEI